MSARSLPRALRLTAAALSVVLAVVVAAHLAYSGLDIGRQSYAVFFDYWLIAVGLAAVTGL